MEYMVNGEKRSLWARFKTAYLKRKKLSITLTVIFTLLVAGGIVWYVMKPSAVEIKAMEYADALIDAAGDEAAQKAIIADIDVYYATLSPKKQEEFNRAMEEYIKSLPSGEDTRVKSVEQKIEEINKYFNEDLSAADQKAFVEALEKFVAEAKDAEKAKAEEKRGNITSFFNGLIYGGDLSEEEEKIFGQKLGEYVKGIKENKQDEVKMEGTFAQVVEYYNALSEDDKVVFVEVVEEVYAK